MPFYDSASFQRWVSLTDSDLVLVTGTNALDRSKKIYIVGSGEFNS